MTRRPQRALSLREDRFSRLEAIDWWDTGAIRKARVLVVGAGALGNEVVKNLALLGIGNLAVLDFDRVERSNLSRSVLFRAADEGSPKAECAVRAARSLYPGLRAHALVGDVREDVGLGWFRWADVVVGALDNREARVFVNAACARVARPWVDGGLDVLSGIVRVFAPPGSACYECTMSRQDWDILQQRRSCSLLARRAALSAGTPTTPTTASVIGGLQAQEVVKFLHGMREFAGRGYVLEGRAHTSYVVDYPVKPDCGWHEAPDPVVSAPRLGRNTALADVWKYAERRLGPLQALDFARELVERLDCPRCSTREDVHRPAGRVSEDQARCRSCGQERVPVFFHSVGRGSSLLRRTVAQVGLPPWDILWARSDSAGLGIELAADRPGRVGEGGLSRRNKTA